MKTSPSIELTPLESTFPPTHLSPYLPQAGKRWAALPALPGVAYLLGDSYEGLAFWRLRKEGEFKVSLVYVGTLRTT